MKQNIHRKINAKGNCLLFYWRHEDRLMRIIKSGYRHIEIYAPEILAPIQFAEHKVH